MASRERVYTAANFGESDRVPICFGGTQICSITECPPNGRVLSELYQYLGIKDPKPIKIPDVFNSIVNLDERLVSRLHSDMVAVTPNPPPAIIHPDGTKTIPYLFGMRVKKVGYYDDIFEFPMRHMTTKKDIDEYPYWPDPNMNLMDGVVERARYLHEETDYFVVGDSFSNDFPFNGYAYLSGMDKWLTDMKVRPKFYHQLAEKFLEIVLAFNDQFFGGIGQYLDAVEIYDDTGMQEGPMMSLADYREFYKPYTAEIIKNIRQYLRPEAKIILHNCGSVYYAIQDFIEIGVDILNPVQPLARDMEPWRLKEEFSGKIAFFGGFDIQKLLPLGTPEQIRQGVEKLMQEYAPGGGYIFGPTMNIQPDTPPENIVAMYDAAYEYSKYPIPERGPGEQNYVDYIKSLRL